MVYGRTPSMKAAALIGVSVAAVTTIVLYVLLVIASFFVGMPAAARNGTVVGGLLAVIFTLTFLVAFRQMVAKLRP